MDEMIRTLLSEPPPSAASVTEARHRLTEEIEGRSPARPPRRAWRWSMAATAAAASVAAIVGVSAVVTSGPEMATPGPDAPASELLLAAAQRAAAAPGPGDRGRYWRVQLIRRENRDGMRGRVGDETFSVGRRSVEEIWLPANPAERTWRGEQFLGVFPLSAQDRAAWERAGSPTAFGVHAGDPSRTVEMSTLPREGRVSQEEDYRRIEVYNLYDPLELAGLPAEPAALRAAAVATVTARGMEVDSGLDVLLFELVKYAPAGPELRAAAFTLLAEQPGLRNIGPRENATGRTGIAIAPRFGAESLILDPDDYTYLGSAFGDSNPERATTITGTWTDEEPVAPKFS